MKQEKMNKNIKEQSKKRNIKIAHCLTKQRVLDEGLLLTLASC